MNTVNAIGLSGFAGSGKSLVANYLERRYGVRRQHIAEPLRAMLRPLFKAYGFDDDTIWAYLEGPLKEQVIPEFGKTPREMQITLGTEWGRQFINDDLWTEAWKRGVEEGIVAVNDSVRFPNEAAAIDALGGFVIRIDRPGVGPAKFTSKLGELRYKLNGHMGGVHPSERIDLIAADYLIENDGTVEQMQGRVDWIMEQNGFYPFPENSVSRHYHLPPRGRRQPAGVGVAMPLAA